MYAGSRGYPANSTSILLLLVRARKEKKAVVSSKKKKLFVLPNIDGLYPKVDTVVHLKQSDISRKLEFGVWIPNPLVELRPYLCFFRSLLYVAVISYGGTWIFLRHWLAPYVISTLKDVFTNQPHCWTHLTLYLCSVLFLSEILMFLGMAILKQAAWKRLQYQQDSKALLCCSVKVSTPSGLSLTQRVLSSTELKKRFQLMNTAFCILESTPSWLFPLLLCYMVAFIFHGFQHTVSISSATVVL